MNVLMLITKGEIGGATNIIYTLAKGLKEKNINIYVGFGSESKEYLKNLLEKEKINYINFKYLKRTYNPIINLLFIFELKNFLSKEKFDIIHFNSSNTLFGAISAKISKYRPKTIFTFHGLSLLSKNYNKFIFLKKLIFLVFKFLLLFIDYLIFISKNNLEYAKKINLINSNKKHALIYNGIIKPQFLSKKEAINFFEKILKINIKNKFIIGSIGRLDYQKNYEFLIKNFNEIIKIRNDSILIIIGDGPKFKKLNKFIEKNKLEQKIFLIKKIDCAVKYLKVFDLFILPSRYEGLPTVLIEALYAKIPVIASNVDGNSEIIGEDFVYEFNNMQSLIKLCKKIIELNLIPQNQADVFSINKFINNHINLYEKIYHTSLKTN